MQDGDSGLHISAADIIERAQGDLTFFASLMIPTEVTVAYPPFYQFLWSHFIKTLKDMDSKINTQTPEEAAAAAKDEALQHCLRFALGLPRGHAKTTFIKLFMCYCILYDLCDFILIVCANESLAQNALEDVDAMLSSEIVEQVWGSWKGSLSRDTKGLKRAMFCGKSKIVAALGAGSSIRGLNIANKRPDFILMDDIQTRENAVSKAESKALMDWMIATLVKARNLHRAFLVFVGNMYNEDCILAKLKLHPQWETFVTGALLSDWTPLWGELFTVEQHLEEYRHDDAFGLGDIWFAEVMNIPIGGAASLLPEGNLPACVYDADDVPIAEFITVDPAGYRKHSDDNCIVRHGVWSYSEYSVREIVAGTFNPGEVVDKTLSMAVEHGITLIGVETVGYQQALKWHFEQKLRSLGLFKTITIVDLKPRNRDKTGRIQVLVQEIYAHTYSIEKAAIGQFLFQARAFRLDKKDNPDDILDCCAYGVDIRNEYGNMLISLPQAQQVSSATGVHVQENNTFLD